MARGVDGKLPGHVRTGLGDGGTGRGFRLGGYPLTTHLVFKELDLFLNFAPELVLVQVVIVTVLLVLWWVVFGPVLRDGEQGSHERLLQVREAEVVCESGDGEAELLWEVDRGLVL